MARGEGEATKTSKLDISLPSHFPNLLAQFTYKQLEELQAFKDQSTKRVAKLGISIENVREDLVASKDQVEHVQVESSKLITKIEEQERSLNTLPKLLHQYILDFESYSSEYRQEIKSLYDDMSRAKGYSQKLQDLNSKMSQNQATWKLREIQRVSYRNMMMSKAKEDMIRETKELSNQLTQLQTLKRLHPTLPYSMPTTHPALSAAHSSVDKGQYGDMHNKRASSIPHYSPATHPQLQPYPIHYISTTTQPPVHPSCTNLTPANSNTDEDIIEVDTDDYRVYNNTSPLTPDSTAINNNNMHNTSITATRATVVGENSMIQIESYEMSVSPWFQDRKRRKIDVYSLQDNFQG
ncbi:hypothetical protein EON65_41910 [archaeon]|nr:MAG: hypothetical protein EON65_41910 [archaeon]